MKYSLTLDCALTLFVWWVLGWTFGAFLIATVVGAVLSVKVATVWDKITNRVPTVAFNRTWRV